MRLSTVAKPVLLILALVALPMLGSSRVSAQAVATDPPRRSRFGPPWPDDTTPVKVNVPREYDTMLSFVPSGDKRSNGTFFVAYPEMRPWPFGSKTCKPLCEGQVAIEISTGEASGMNRQAWSFLRELQQAPGQGAPAPNTRISITTATPPPDYTQAWSKVDHQPNEMFPMPIEMAIYLRAGTDGAPREYVECATLMPRFQSEPACQVYTTLDGNPAVHVSLRYLTRHWPEREAIRAAAMRLVQSWL